LGLVLVQIGPSLQAEIDRESMRIGLKPTLPFPPKRSSLPAKMSFPFKIKRSLEKSTCEQAREERLRANADASFSLLFGDKLSISPRRCSFF
jgi:hypothetical protein